MRSRKSKSPKVRAFEVYEKPITKLARADYQVGWYGHTNSWKGSYRIINL